MRGRGRLTACIAVVLLAHAGLLAALLHTSASDVRRHAPHRVAAVRMIVLGPVAEPRVVPPPPPRLAAEGDSPPAPDVPTSAHPSPAAVPHLQAPAARSAQAPERAPTPAPQVPTIAPLRDFLSPAQVDRIAIAFPSPDISALSGLSWSGLPIRVRLFIDASGQCVEAQMLDSSEDAVTQDKVRRMFLATHFIPARRAGADVGSYRDIELDVTDVK